MVCMVRVVYINANLVIDRYCRAMTLSVECARNAVPVSYHSLNEPWLQVF
jgi:hypothetical protein